MLCRYSMRNIGSLLCLFGLLVMGSCTSNSETEKYQKRSDNIVNVRAHVKPIQIEDVLIGSIARSFLLGDYLIIGDYKSSDKLIHIFNKNSFAYLASIAYVGQGPGEITVMGHIGTDEKRHKFYVSDHGKQKYSVMTSIVFWLILMTIPPM